jgi:hypothetical protein
MTMRTWLVSMFMRHDPAPAGHSREDAPDTRRVPAWRTGRLPQGGCPGAPPDAVTSANANANLDTLKLPVSDTVPHHGSPGR